MSGGVLHYRKVRISDVLQSFGDFNLSFSLGNTPECNHDVTAVRLPTLLVAFATFDGTATAARLNCEVRP